MALPPPANLVSTHATAHRRLPNTVADVSVEIQTEAATVAALTKTLATRSQMLIAYLKREGAERLTTDQVNVNTKTHTVKGGRNQIVGYSGTIAVSFRTTPEKVSDLVTGALTQGANTLQQVSFAPREEEIDAARQELAAEATRTALAQAEAVTKAAGERVTGIREIVVDPENGVRPLADSYESSRATSFAALAKPASPPPIATASGDQEVRMTVDMRVEIAK